jgi:hypothetical protein
MDRIPVYFFLPRSPDRPDDKPSLCAVGFVSRSCVRFFFCKGHTRVSPGRATSATSSGFACSPFILVSFTFWSIYRTSGTRGAIRTLSLGLSRSAVSPFWTFGSSLNGGRSGFRQRNRLFYLPFFVRNSDADRLSALYNVAYIKCSIR